MRKKKGFITKRKLIFFGGLLGIGFLITLINLFVSIVTAKEAESVVFTSGDRLNITADIYLPHETSTSPFIILFHQANWSRGEYRETAVRLNKLGYNCLAVDLRSGNKVKGVKNQTAQRAQALGKSTRFVDALQDMIAALAYVRKTYNPPKLLILGSSYSAGLAIKLAGDKPGMMDGLLAFSPGEYFVKNGMSHTWVLESAKKITIPVFIASAKKEKNRWIAIYNAINTNAKIGYLPSTPGKHGSRALWKQYPESERYWAMMETYLKTYF